MIPEFQGNSANPTFHSSGGACLWISEAEPLVCE